MAGRESAEDKIRRMIGEALADGQRRQEEDKNPAFATLRRIIREEVGAVLTEQRGGGRSRSRRDDEGDDQDDDRRGGGLADILGLG